MTVKTWEVPKAWAGEACAILAGGPSLVAEQVEAIRASRVRVIVINNSFNLIPEADVLYFCDARWWMWHEHEILLQQFKGQVVTLDNETLCAKYTRIRTVKNIGRNGLSLKPGEIYHGSNSGYQAINLAVQFGVKQIFLFGYDMKAAPDGRVHWHVEHEIPTPKAVFRNLMIPAYEGLNARCQAVGVTVINCSPNSALREFPYQDYHECLPLAETRTALQE